MALDIKWSDIKPKLEEEEFKKAKKTKLDEQNAAEEEQAEGEEEAAEEETEGERYEPMGLAELGAELWNESAVPKGYDAISEQQKAFLDKHTGRLEEKWLKDRLKILPEIEAGLSHIIVYLPKWLKYRREHKEDKK